jgi:hypothetical protein
MAKIVAALRKSTKLVVNEEGTMVRRCEPLPSDDVLRQNALGRTLYAKKFPVDSTLDELNTFFEKLVGPVLCVRFVKDSQPDDLHPGKSIKVFKGTAFVEFESKEVMEKGLRLGSGKEDGRGLVFRGDGPGPGTVLSTESRQVYQDRHMAEDKKARAALAEKQAKAALAMKSGPPPAAAGQAEGDDFVKGRIVHFRGAPEGSARDTFTRLCSPYGKVQFVEFKRGETDGFVRFEQPESAAHAVVRLNEAAQAAATATAATSQDEKAGAGVSELYPSGGFELVSGEAEAEYWRKVVALQTEKRKAKDSQGGGNEKKRQKV